jgi:hypothetical protein
MGSIALGAPEVIQVDEAYPGSLTELLRVPTLRSVRFHRFSFTPVLFQATAKASIEGIAFTKFELDVCSFSAGECAAIMATGLSRNTSVISISVVQCNNARVLNGALAAALPSNSTLRNLELGRQDSFDPDKSAIFPALGIKLSVHVGNLTYESLRIAMKDGLGMNATLKSLKLKEVMRRRFMVQGTFLSPHH